MWGSDAQVRASALALTTGEEQTTPQLARIDYGRPETWSFFFFAHLLSSTFTTGRYDIRFDLLLGSGRTAVSIPSFCLMQIFSNDAGPNFGRRYTKSVRAPAYNNQPPDDTVGPLIEDFSAQSINCVARVQATSELDDMVGQLTIAAWFAPRAHIRPEWFRPNEKFRGGEDNGL